jgi:hypothetical protein
MVRNLINCIAQPQEWTIKELTRYRDMWAIHNQRDPKRRIHLQDLVTMWQGKFRAVVHENNALRKKLRKAGLTL